MWNPLATQQCRKLKCSLFQKGNSSLSRETCCLALQVNCHILVQLRFFSRQLTAKYYLFSWNLTLSSATRGLNQPCPSPNLNWFFSWTWTSSHLAGIFLLGRKGPTDLGSIPRIRQFPIIFFFWLPRTVNNWKWVHQCRYMDREWLERSYIIRVVLGQHECVLVLTVITMDA